MNQEKIMKARMIAAYIICGITLAALLVFIGLYTDESRKTQAAYKAQYMFNLQQAKDEIDIYIAKKTDYDLHYNMLLSDMGAARSMLFLVKDYSKEKKNLMNEFHYCFVKYPEQMSGLLEPSSKAIGDIVDNLDKGYDEVGEIIGKIDKKGR